MEKVKDYLSKIQVSSNHLLGIVNEVLEISRIESGQTKLDETVCSIADIANETSVIIGDQTLEKNQKFTTDISQIQNLYVYCDCGNSVPGSSRPGRSDNPLPVLHKKHLLFACFSA